ncbi:MAG: hypothetical protein HQL67_01930 [Magnetococcales bacterium]|nr:hypothetical protein [Magnetococcales bacterium]
MNTSVRKPFKTTLLAGAALLAATMIAPQPAKADATLAAVLGGTALLGLVLHASQPIAQPAPRYHHTSSSAHTGYHQGGYPQSSAAVQAPDYGYQPQPYSQAYAAPVMQKPTRLAIPAYPSYAPVVYASVTPAAVQPNPVYRVSQPVNYQITAPTHVSSQKVYHSSANMQYPVAPAMHSPMPQPAQPSYGSMYQQMHQQMHQQMQQQTMEQPAQAQQMSYYPQQGVGAVQPQYGTTYPQY